MRKVITTFGDKGENAAARYLRKQGFKIVDRQHKTQFGEIDLICRDGETWVFVEVKTRQSVATGRGDEAVTHSKQKQLTRVAMSYLKKRDLLDQPCRFDVVSILWPAESKKPEITHYRSAFEAIGSFQMFS